MGRKGYWVWIILLIVDLGLAIFVEAAHRKSQRAGQSGNSAVSATSPLELLSRADPNQLSATAGALMIPQVNQRAFSSDGRYVVFQSSSENIIDGLTQSKITAN